MSAAALPFQPMLDALALPESAWVGRRVPREQLDQREIGSPPARKAVQQALSALWWLAILRPNTVGLPAPADGGAPEIAVLGASITQAERAPRVAGLLHRAIPYPVLLLVADDAHITMSIAEKRPSVRDPARLVLEGSVITGPRVAVSGGRLMEAPPSDLQALGSLALAAQPDADLGACYRGWAWSLMAWRAAKITGHFRRPTDEAAANRLASLLAGREALEREAVRSDRAIAKATQLRRRVDLTLQRQALGEKLRLNGEELLR